MKRNSIFLILLIVFYFAVFNNTSSDFTASLLPGWHTTIIPPQTVAFAFLGWLIIVITAYYFLLKNYVKKSTVIIFSTFSIPFLIIYILNSTGVLRGNDQMILLNIFFASLLLFIVAQLIFSFYFFKGIIKAFKN
ncbi:hypothetical protein GR160_16995 [Flavobacterium sp. Sd200]|uniref:hypothetical protein n=1 Tax=Flavobacterium sp. Sd200 TaxID=2692211 RepID=UPI00136B98BF|nr:hypothetical protein [Flavobacterium sp. Sd200]MXN92926.1 hypothetical protein [Flavobacterium sp. Sd200]